MKISLLHAIQIEKRLYSILYCRYFFLIYSVSAKDEKNSFLLLRFKYTHTHIYGFEIQCREWDIFGNPNKTDKRLRIRFP